MVLTPSNGAENFLTCIRLLLKFCQPVLTAKRPKKEKKKEDLKYMLTILERMI